MKKSEKIRIIGWIIYLLALITLLTLVLIIHHLLIIIITISTFILGYLVMCIIHSTTTHYECPSCHQIFKINFIQDMFSKSGGRLGKKVTCPACKKQDYMVDETD